MINTPMNFTYEYLNSLKFKEIQKLSVHFNVNKRWAKKQELIENLLALKAKSRTENDNKEKDEKEWKDGSTIFNDLNVNSDIEINRRLTFNINTKTNADASSSHANFEDQQELTLLCGHTNARETYDIPPKKIDLGIEPLMESRSTFDIFPKENLIDEINPRATFNIPQNGKKLLEDCKINSDKDNLVSENLTNSEMKITYVNNPGQSEKLKTIKFDLNLKNKKFKGNNKTKSQEKMLTIPYAKVTGRTPKHGILKNDNSPIRISKKSINIKKMTKLPLRKNELLKSPIFSSVQESVNKQSIFKSLNKSQTGSNLQTKVSIRFENMLESDNKGKTKKVLHRKVSTSADENLKSTGIAKSNCVRVNFGTLPPSMISSRVTPLKKKSVLKVSNERNVPGKLNSSTAQTPGDKAVIATKAITATKMPDFNKIHKKQFEQMDSLHDYIRKKEERVKKLFGAPQPGQQLQVHMKLAPLLQFQSEIADKESTGKKKFKSLITSFKRKEQDSKSAQKEALKSRLPPPKLQNNIKNKNRSLIQGVRTNKRFELQMKLRNI